MITYDKEYSHSKNKKIKRLEKPVINGQLQPSKKQQQTVREGGKVISRVTALRYSKCSIFSKRLQGLPRNTGERGYLTKYWLVTVFDYVI